MNRGALVGLALAMASGAMAQMAMSARDSDVNLYWLGGFAGDTHGGTPSASDENLYMASGAGLVGNDGANGTYAGNTWSLTVGWNLAHSYQVSGSLGSGTRIESSGSSVLTSFTSGASLTMRSTLPGNRLQLTFTLAEGRVMKLLGTLNAPADPSRGQASVMLNTSNGSGFTGYWGFIGTSSTFLGFRYVPAGTYRIDSECTLSADLTEVATSGWSYDLEVMPFVPGAVNGSVTGRVLFDQYAGRVEREKVDVEFYSTSGTYLGVSEASLTFQGFFSVAIPTTVVPGQVNLRLRGDTTLRTLVPSVTLTPNQDIFIGTWTLRNGDCDRSGEIDAADIDLVIANFGGVEGSSGFVPAGDPDGSGEVDAADIDLVIAGFGGVDQ